MTITKKPDSLQNNNKFHDYHNRNKKFFHKHKFKPYRNPKDKTYYRSQNNFTTQEHINNSQKIQCQMYREFGQVLIDRLLLKNSFMTRNFNF